MRGSPDWPLRPLLSRGAAARAWTPAARHRAFRLPTTGLGPPRPWGAGPGLPGRGAGLARLLGLWARLPGAPRVPRAALPGGPAVAARAGDEAWRRGPATPRDDSRLRPAAPGRSEARKLLGLAYPERRRLAGLLRGRRSFCREGKQRNPLRPAPVRKVPVPFPESSGAVICKLQKSGETRSQPVCYGATAVNRADGNPLHSRGERERRGRQVSGGGGGGTVLCGRYLRTLSKRTQDSLAQATQLAEERIGNIRTVRAFGKEMAEVETYTRKVDDVMQLARRAAFAQAGFFGVVSTSFWKGRKGQVFSWAESSSCDSCQKTGQLGNWRPPRVAEGVVLKQTSFQGALQFRNVHFAYPARPEVPVFRDFSLSIPAGSVTALVGPSGSGKSTVVSLLLRLYDPGAGTIRLDGHDIRQLNPVWLRSKIGTVSQEPILFSCSIAENIAYGADDPSSVTAEQVERVADVANATAFIRSFPQGFSTVVGEKGTLLSGGQKQRIAVARALLKNPKILLLDEATSALDAENEHLVQEALDRLMEGRTVLIIAHRLSTIKNADVVAVLDQGRITEYGKHEDLLSNPDGMYRKLMNKQSTSW
ncbi:ATP-binding cassette sub-family B member 10, mitochondrial [Pteropus medius]|uniref:ATP-binding cassette sub-family B member 10, mitochondrial n=1 Tax=Pteropus vampyrus TaxID=132908 RepID=UPI00196A9B8A|nr:ATP-binding cassette sub-family B member 10, mitochondrial [Pteropus giganteus]